MRKFAIRTVFAVGILAAAANPQAPEGRKVIAHPAPVYPDTARKFSISGVVKVQVLIAADGHIKEVKIIGGHPMLVNAVQETLKSWQYAPGPADSTATLEFSFRP